MWEGGVRLLCSCCACARPCESCLRRSPGELVAGFAHLPWRHRRVPGPITLRRLLSYLGERVGWLDEAGRGFMFKLSREGAVVSPNCCAVPSFFRPAICFGVWRLRRACCRGGSFALSGGCSFAGAPWPWGPCPPFRLKPCQVCCLLL